MPISKKQIGKNCSRTRKDISAFQRIHWYVAGKCNNERKASKFHNSKGGISRTEEVFGLMRSGQQNFLGFHFLRMVSCCCCCGRKAEAERDNVLFRLRIIRSGLTSEKFMFGWSFGSVLKMLVFGGLF